MRKVTRSQQKSSAGCNGNLSDAELFVSINIFIHSISYIPLILHCVRDDGGRPDRITPEVGSAPLWPISSYFSQLSRAEVTASDRAAKTQVY